jgi:transcriptional regulator with XRE-family HTH domain
MPEYLTTDQVVDLLKEDRGDRTLEEYAKVIGVSYQFIAHVLRGVRQPGKKMLKHLNIKKLTLYTYVRNGRK